MPEGNDDKPAQEASTPSGAESGKTTELIHLSYEGNFQLDCSATIVACNPVSASNENDEGKEGKPSRVEIQLDVTTMHPQGGGQPTDIGTISTHSETDSVTPILSVDRVTMDRATGIVTHSGTLSTTADEPLVCFPVGSKVQVKVDKDKRRILSECHTAGHVVDAAMARCDIMMPPTKGYHFLDGPYVEYRGAIPANDRPAVLEKLKAAFQEIVKEDIPTTIETVTQAEADAQCNNLAQNFVISDYASGDSDVRVVTVGGWSCPCGGTHVASTLDLAGRKWGVTGLKCKKNVVRVKYGQNSTA